VVLYQYISMLSGMLDIGQAFRVIYTKPLELQLGGKSAHPHGLIDSLSDWGESEQPTTPQLKGRRVYHSVSKSF
jgi:hypothetical protein